MENPVSKQCHYVESDRDLHCLRMTLLGFLGKTGLIIIQEHKYSVTENLGQPG